MKVALVCPYAWDRPGGVQSHIRGLAGALEGRDHEVAVLAPASRRGVSERGLRVVGRSVAVPANGSVAALAFGPGTLARTKAALRAFAPDVVHAHEPLIPSVSLLATLSASAPVIGTFHASADSSLGYRLAQPLLERAARKLDARTAVSDAARALIAHYFPGDYVLTPNGIDAATFEDPAGGERSDDKRVLFLGRIERRKGLEVLIQAMTRIRGQAALVVAGDGPERRSCERLARDLHVEASFMGAFSDSDKAGLYAAADVFCAPGLGGESFGIVLIEAMAAGSAVVCSDLPGFRGAAGAAARFVPAGDPDALAGALAELLGDDAARARAAKLGRQLARSFDWQRLVAGVESIYERVLNASQIGSRGGIGGSDRGSGARG